MKEVKCRISEVTSLNETAVLGTSVEILKAILIHTYHLINVLTCGQYFDVNKTWKCSQLYSSNCCSVVLYINVNNVNNTRTYRSKKR